MSSWERNPQQQHHRSPDSSGSGWGGNRAILGDPAQRPAGQGPGQGSPGCTETLRLCSETQTQTQTRTAQSISRLLFLPARERERPRSPDPVNTDTGH